MTTQLILARTTSGCIALFVNQTAVLEEYQTNHRQVEEAARRLSVSLGVPLVECTVEVPDELDGKWVWPDLLNLLPPVQEQMRKHPFVVYGWQEGGVHEATWAGPGDAWDEAFFDFEPPIAGTPYAIFAPLYESREQSEGSVQAKVLNDFEYWLNDRRIHDVSFVFHDIVAKVKSLINLAPVMPAPEQLVEQIAMSLLGKTVDPAPGVNWYCNRSWTVQDVRTAVGRALATVGIIEHSVLDDSSGANC